MVLLLALGISLTATTNLQAQSSVPAFISYQGQVLDNTGAPVGVGTPVNRTVTFRIWDSPSGSTDANLIYSEAQTVTIFDGDFSVLVGQGVATTIDQYGFSETPKSPPNLSIANAFNGEARYLGVTIDDGTAAVDNEVAPRQRIVSSAFAFRAKEAESITNGSLQGGSLAGNIDISGATFSGGIFNNASFNTLNTGQGATELYLMNQHVRTIDSPTFATINTGQGYTELHLMNQNVRTVDSPTFSTINTGHGYTELHLMNQNVRTVDSPSFATTTSASFQAVGWNSGVSLRESGTERGAFGWAGNSGAYSNSATYGDAVLRATTSKLHMQSGQGNAAMTIDTNNRVGIWTTSPLAPLDVRGSGVQGSGWGFFLNNYIGNLSHPLTIRADWSVQAASFMTVSDQRIKKIKQRSNPAEDLKLIQQLQVTDYQMVDEIQSGKAVKTGFIAQEVQKVLPIAVSEGRGTVPDIYAHASNLEYEPSTKLLSIEMKSPHGLSAGDMVHLVMPDQKADFEVVGVTSSKTFTVEMASRPEKLFVFGKVVEDFHSVDYDTIYTKGISAIQELASQVETLRDDKARMQAELSAQAQRIAELEAKDKARDNKLSAIEKMLSDDRREAVSVSLKSAAAN